MNRSIKTAGLSALTLLLAVSAVPARELSFEQRVTAQKAIEQVYWNHRIWPKENPDSKPQRAAVMSDQAIRAKVEDYLKKSNALERRWQRSVTTEQLQAEIDRMAKNTRDGAMLGELFGALGNDPFVIAETLGRQTLVDRLIRSSYASDTRLHGEVRARAEAACAACANVDCMRSMGGEYRETTWKLHGEGADVATDEERDHVVQLAAAAWTDHLGRLAKELGATVESLPTRRLSGLEETPEAFVVTTVLAQRAGEIETATVAWPIRSFDAWWSVERAAFGSEVEGLSGTIVLPSAPATMCSIDTWTPMQAGPFDARSGHTAVWTGTEMVVWAGFNGGWLNTGGRYDPATDTWTPTSTGPNVPSAREGHTAVWTGRDMIVWGGTLSDPLGSGGRYDPSTDTWTTMSTGPYTPFPRAYHTAVWTGTEMIVWGGLTLGVPGNTGGRYAPSTDRWIPTSTGPGVPLARYAHTAVWTGTEMIVWAGYNGGLYQNTGGRYDPSTNSWTSTSTTGVPVGRRSHTAVWTGTEMIVWGGSAAGVPLHFGGRYSPSGNSWIATSTSANVPTPRAYHTAVWTGTEMIIWGGSNPSFALNTGGRYDPANDTWMSTSMGLFLPNPRDLHTAVWTGTQMIVWGGDPLALPGGVYCACPSGRIYFLDADGDGYGNSGAPRSVCDGSLPAGYVADATDCNDGSTAIHPGVAELCDGVDGNCDDVVPADEADADGDGARICSGDCNDANPLVYRGAPEVNDGLDNQCPGDPGFGPRDEISGFLTQGDKTQLSWTAQAGASAYTVVRSPYRDLHAGCRRGETVLPQWSDPEAPPPGGVFYYLVRAADPIVGSWGLRSSGAERTVCAVCESSSDACDDGNACTAGDQCSGIVCSSGPPRNCDDAEGCTGDACNPVSGCVHTNSTAACDDGSVCTTGDTCGGGTCNGGPATSCDDGNVCTDDSCNPVSGCVHTDITAVCDDENACTADSCNPTSGCVNIDNTAACDDGDACTDDVCNPLTGCVHTNNTAGCDDGNTCTTGDICQGGACAGTIPAGVNHLVISQVQVAGDGAGGPNDEFIEIYNPTSSAVDIHSWSLQSVISTSPFVVAARTLGNPASIPAHGWFLLAGPQYNGPVSANRNNNEFALASTGGTVFLVPSSTPVTSCSAAEIVDKVAFGNGACSEGVAALAPSANDSILRRPGGACGNGTDTDSNNADFVIQSPSTPRNSASTPQP